MTALSPFLSWIALLGLQDAEPPAQPSETLPDGVAALVGDERITIDEYKDYLLRVYGKRPLDDLIYERLLEKRAGELGVTVSDEEIRAAWDDFHQSMLRRHRGDARALEEELLQAGWTVDGYRRQRMREDRLRLLAERVCVREREVTEEMVRERFDREYGKDGRKVEVRHVMVTRARTKAELVERGAEARELSIEKLDERIRAKADEILAKLRAGADFEELARAESHDISVHQNGGIIPGYNYLRYGPELAEAVRAAEVGVPTGPVETPAGVHVIEVVSRVVTDLEDVREEVRALCASDPASWPELNALRAELLAAQPILKF